MRMLATALLAVACTAAPVAEPIRVIVRVTDGAYSPVPLVRVFVDGSSAGSTDRNGRASLEVQGPDGRRIGVEVLCPPGSRDPSSLRREVRLRPLRTAGNGSEPRAWMEIDFACLPAIRPHVLVVRTDRRAGLPVWVLGRRVGATDDDGVLETVLTARPGGEIEVMIDTASRPELRPAMPARRLAVPDRSQILLFDQVFETRSTPAVRKRPRGPRRL
ncbi:MAG: hypothetical protein PHU25_01380 [Deltaproteobacteria bacterium]|nr:hypothetical protein [Deltaproteobacteria bacterium]